MTFTDALALLRGGRSIARKAWAYGSWIDAHLQQRQPGGSWALWQPTAEDILAADWGDAGAASKEAWPEAYRAAEAALVYAAAVIDDVAGWSGSSGDWGVQGASGRVARALEALREPEWPDDCQCTRALHHIAYGTWFGPCEDTRHHKIECPVAKRAHAAWAERTGR